jgi:hypothetical protein
MQFFKNLSMVFMVSLVASIGAFFVHTTKQQKQDSARHGPPYSESERAPLMANSQAHAQRSDFDEF